MNRIQLPPDSHTLDDLKVGRVLATRINDVMARPSSKRHLSYLGLLNRQIRGFGDIDENDRFRDRELLPRALQAYEIRHGVKLARGYFYHHSEYDFIGCAPDAIESDLIGLTVHVRQSEDSYEAAVENSINNNYLRVAQASMAVTGLKYWLQLDYWEDPGERKRRLHETLFERSPLADELTNRLAWFYCQAAQTHLKA